MGAQFYAHGVFCYAEVFVFYSSSFSMCLVLCRQCFFLMRPPPTCTKHQHTFRAHGERIGRICKLCICTCPGDPGTHDMVLEVPLKRCVVLDSLKLKRSPAQSTSIFFTFTLTLCIECMECGGVLVRWCGGVVAWCCGVNWYVAV